MTVSALDLSAFIGVTSAFIGVSKDFQSASLQSEKPPEGGFVVAATGTISPKRSPARTPPR